MRPFVAEADDRQPPGRPLDAVALYGFLIRSRGRHCNVCERPLFTDWRLAAPSQGWTLSVVGDGGFLSVAGRPLPPAADLLVLCIDCVSYPGRLAATPVGASDLRFAIDRAGTVAPASQAAAVLDQAYGLSLESVTGWRSEQRAAAWAEAELLAEETSGQEPERRAAMLRRRVAAFGFPTVWAVALQAVGDEGGLQAAFSTSYDEVAPNPAPGSPDGWFRVIGVEPT